MLVIYSEVFFPSLSQKFSRGSIPLDRRVTRLMLMLQLVATQSLCREQTVYVCSHHSYNTDDLNYVLIRSMRSTALQTPQAGQVMYITSAGQGKI